MVSRHFYLVMKNTQFLILRLLSIAFLLFCGAIQSAKADDKNNIAIIAGQFQSPGDLLTLNSASFPTRLGVGTAGQVLSTNGTTLSWASKFAMDTGTAAAAGTTAADCVALTASHSRVTGADATKGACLPLLASRNIGDEFIVTNADTTNALKVYSAGVAELISGQAGTTAISLAAKLQLICRKYDTTNWYCGKTVTPY